MARKKKMIKKSNRARASTVREDYRKGGRVRLHSGSGDTHTAPIWDPDKQKMTIWDPHNPNASGHKVDSTLGPQAPGTGTSKPAEEAAPKPIAPSKELFMTGSLGLYGSAQKLDKEAWDAAMAKYEKEAESWDAAEALRRSKIYGQDGTTSAVTSDKIGTFGGAVTTPKGDVATLTGEEQPKWTKVTESPRGFVPPSEGAQVSQEIVNYYNPETGQTFSTSTGGWQVPKEWHVGVPSDIDAKLPARVEAGITTDADVEAIDAPTAADKVLIIPKGFSETPLEDVSYPTPVPPEDKMKWIYGPNGERKAVPEWATAQEVTTDDMTTAQADAVTVDAIYEPRLDDKGNPIPGSIKVDEDGNPVPKATLTAAQYEAVKAAVIPIGFSETPPVGVLPSTDEPGKGMKWVYGSDGKKIAVSEVAVSLVIDPATGTLSEDSKAKVIEIRNLTEKAAAAERDKEAEEEAKVTETDRPEYKDYATAATTDERWKIIEAEDPELFKRIAQTISEREKQDLLAVISKEGTNLDDIPEFMLAVQREAQTGQYASRIAQELGDAPSVDLEGREAITGTAPSGDAAQIGGIPTMAAATMQAVQGNERIGAAADMAAVTANMPSDVVAAIAENPAEVEAQLDTGNDPQTIAAIAALPPEALVSVQMEYLLAGLEGGEIPLWARPAVDAVNQGMATRGLSVSTVGRDALFNAIIQSALPMAQSNAQALQARAQQNLSNQQQANLSTAQQTIQVRLQNLANRQTASSQTAQMAQQIKVQQGQFKQEAVILTAQQQQQTELVNAQMAQQKAQQESAQRQEMAVSNLDVGSRLDLANLQAESFRAGKQLDADQQAKLQTYNAKVAKIMRQADLEQDMEKANLSSEIQLELANLSEQNIASRDTMTAENQERLTNLNVLVDFKKTNANLAQQMDLANMSNEQQLEMSELADRAATDSANFTEANRFKLQRLSMYVNVMSQNTELRQRAEMAQLSSAEKVDLANLSAKNQADSESMDASNINALQTYEKKMQAGQVNAQLAQQVGLANLSNRQSAAMFNAQIDANLDIKKFDADQQVEIANSQFMQTMTIKNYDGDQQAAIQNATALASLDLAAVDQRTRLAIENARNFLQMDMANLNNLQQTNILSAQLKQQRILSDQAAGNASLQFNATSENQTNQFMRGLAAQISQFNSQQSNAMSQFNTAETNRMEAIEAGNNLEANKFNTQISAQIDQYNASLDFQRDQWNTSNAQAIEQSNIAWRRKANTIDTAAKNAVNQQNAQNSFSLTRDAQSALWQELRDKATFSWQGGQNQLDRISRMLSSALSSDTITATADLGWESGSDLQDLMGMFIDEGEG